MQDLQRAPTGQGDGREPHPDCLLSRDRGGSGEWMGHNSMSSSWGFGISPRSVGTGGSGEPGYT